MNICELADVVPALNYYTASAYQYTPNGQLYRVRRNILKKVNGSFRWVPVGVVEDGLTASQVAERYPGLSAGHDAAVALVAAIAAYESLMSAGTPDFRPGETLPEDYYAL